MSTRTCAFSARSPTSVSIFTPPFSTNFDVFVSWMVRCLRASPQSRCGSMSCSSPASTLPVTNSGPTPGTFASLAPSTFFVSSSSAVSLATTQVVALVTAFATDPPFDLIRSSSFFFDGVPPLTMTTKVSPMNGGIFASAADEALPGSSSFSSDANRRFPVVSFILPSLPPAAALAAGVSSHFTLSGVCVLKVHARNVLIQPRHL
mmetsp:Transcript_20602/g.57718  ORF Transcript_20602/g.57718 Transcript_20602/m.57718 type:complete len:205 (-) Transcript_20602:638-1252(-)